VLTAFSETQWFLLDNIWSKHIHYLLYTVHIFAIYFGNNWHTSRIAQCNIDYVIKGTVAHSVMTSFYKYADQILNKNKNFNKNNYQIFVSTNKYLLVVFEM